MKKIAVILCGSGFKDGSEIREAVGTLWALSQEKVSIQCFAPDAPQFDVVNTLTGEASKETRNMLVESARIARGQIKSLSELNTRDFQGIVMPGGFGAAKNLCTFAMKGSQGTVRPDIEEILKKFHSEHKPIGAICIAPAIVAMTFRKGNFDLTVGEKGEASQEIEKLGHHHVVKKANECLVDEKHKIVTTPAYMYDEAPLHDIFVGIQKLVKEVVKLA